MQNVSQSTFVCLVVHVELAIASTDFHVFIVVHFRSLLKIVSECSTAAETWHIILREPGTLFIYKNFQSFDIPVFFNLLLIVNFLGLHFAFSSVRIATNPPFELDIFLFFIEDHWLPVYRGCFLFLSSQSKSIIWTRC